MGVLARITQFTNGGQRQSQQSTSRTGDHAIDHNKVLAPTDNNVISPLNPGNFRSVRTAPVNHDPRYFNQAEADGLKQLAKQKTQDARHTKKAYNALTKIEEADAKVHKHHREYIRGVADGEMVKKKSDVKTAKHLHTQRPQYAQLGSSLNAAADNAQKRINELKAKVKENY